MNTPTLETPRLILRPVTIEDAPAIQRHFGRWAIIRHLSTGVPWPYPPDGAERFLADVCLPAMQRGDALIWAITRKEAPHEAIGLVDVYREARGDAGHRGFWLAEPWQGQGLMTEAVTAVQDHLFLELELPRIIVTHSQDNAASRRVKEKTGARRMGTGELPHHDGETITELWEVTREGWVTFRKGQGAGGPRRHP